MRGILTNLAGLLFSSALLFLSPEILAQQNTVRLEPAYQQVSLTGFTRARKKLELSSELAGKVEEITVELGEAIPESGLFACLDNTLIELDRSVNRAEQARSRAEITFVEKQRDRYLRLVKSNSSAQTQLDEAERSLAVSRQQLQTLIIQAEQLRERSQRHCLMAPVGWLVMERQVEVGQWVSAGQPLVRLGDYSSLLIHFALSQHEFSALQANSQSLSLSFPDQAQSLKATIRHVAPGFDPASRKIQVHLEVSASGPINRGGLRAELKLSLADASGACLIPVAALQERYEEYWLRRDNGDEVRVVYLGLEKPLPGSQQVMARIISDQIKPGEQFILPGQ